MVNGLLPSLVPIVVEGYFTSRGEQGDNGMVERVDRVYVAATTPR